MSNFLDGQVVCYHCGRGTATRPCPCKSASFCNKACQKVAWPEHRLSCSAAKPPSTAFGLGDIVKIEGLQSAVGQTMNGKLAEVCQVEPNGDRFGVITTIPIDNNVQTIKSARLKPQNLTLQLSAHDAAKKAAKRATVVIDERSEHEEILDCFRVACCTIPTLTGEEIVRHISEERDKHFMQALILSIGGTGTEVPLIPVVSAEVCQVMFQAGLIDACLKPLKFPELIDEGEEDDPREMEARGPITIASYIHLLCICLDKRNFGLGKEARLNQYSVEICQKLGPAIVLCANKKRRLRGQTENWLSSLASLMRLLQKCVIVQPTTLQVLMQELDPTVKVALLDLVVFALTVDPRLFLQQSTLLHEPFLKECPADVKICTLPVLVELVNMTILRRQAVGHNFDRLLVPRGAPYGMAGRKFVASWLDIAALCSMEVLDSAQLGWKQLLKGLQYIYRRFWNIPSIRQQLGEFDEGFTYCRSSEELRRWSKQRIDVLSRQFSEGSR